MKRLLLAVFLLTQSLLAQQGGYPGTPVSSAQISQPVLNASSSLVSGSDIGAKVNTLFAQLTTASQYGTVTIDPTQGTYAQTTTIKIPRGDTLDCQGAKLTWAASTGEPVIYGDLTTNYVTGTLRNCTFVGTGSTNSTIAIYAGGDPSAVITPTATFGNFFSIYNTSVSGFGTAYTHGSNVWGGDITNSLFFSNANGIASMPTSATNAGEYDHIVNSKIFNNTGCALDLANSSDNWIVENSQLDYNVGGAVCGTQASVELNSNWMEQYQGPLVNVTGTSGPSQVKISGGNMVVTATPYTITNVAINGSNVLTLTTSASVTGLQAGFTETFSGLTTATFLNGTTGTIISASGNTINLNYSHVTYASASDTGTVTPVSADLIHVEGAFQSYLQMDRVGYNNHGGQTVTTILGVGYTGSQSGARTRVCTLNASNGASVYSLTGTALSGCVYGATLQQQIGSTFATQSPSSFYYSTAQGWNIAWNLGLNSRSGEMDLVNVHGGGNGGFNFCDIATSGTASTCQLSVDASGNVTLQGRLIPGTIYSAAGTAIPVCSSTLKGQEAVVSDATSPTFLVLYTSGGTVVSPVLCNGTNWVTY